jgi:hypothetical protein
MGEAYSTNGEKRNVYKLMVGKPEGKRPLGRLILCLLFCKFYEISLRSHSNLTLH